MKKFDLKIKIVESSLIASIMGLLIGLMFSSQAQAAEKGIRLGAFIKDPSGNIVNQTLSQVDVQILAPNGCVLMGERFSSVVVSNGYLYLDLFKGTRNVAELYDQGKSSIDVFADQGSHTGLTCLNADGTTNGTLNIFTPAEEHVRYVRVTTSDLGGVSDPFEARFKIGSMPHAMVASKAALATSALSADNALKLEGKSASEFVLASSVGTTSGTVAAGDDSRFADSRAPSGAAGGDLAGTYPNPMVSNVGVDKISSGNSNSGLYFTYKPNGNQCVEGQVLKWVTANLRWECATDSGSSGVITSVTALAPIISSGGTTPQISMAQATGSANGYLSSADWTTFNSKQAGNTELTGLGSIALTGIVQRTAAGAYTGLGLTAPLSVTGADIGMTQANTTTPGYLSAADWNTFNGKQNALGFAPLSVTDYANDVAGVTDTSCTANQKPYWNSGTGLWACSAIGSLDAAAISSGTLDVLRVPNLDAAKITSGTIDSARLPASASYWSAATGGIAYLNGKVGIGSTASAPQARLEIEESDFENGLSLKNITSNSTLSPNIRLMDSQATPQSVYLRKEGDALVVLDNAGTARLKIASNTTVDSYLNVGNVAIGHVAPFSRLDVRGVASNTEVARFANSSGESGVSIQQPLATGNTYSILQAYHTSGSVSTNLMLNPNGGNVGIGTTAYPQGALEVTSTTGALVPPRMTEAQRDALATSPDGAVVYNTTTNKMNIRQASAWQEVVTGTVTVTGRTSCPAGFTLIGTSGSTEAFCISSTMETSATWLGANQACRAKDPKARLCSAGEWAAACVDGASGPNNMTGHWEWVADLYLTNGQLMGNAGCDSFLNYGVSSSNGSRCCFR